MKSLLLTLVVAALLLAGLVGITLFLSEGYSKQQASQIDTERNTAATVSYDGTTFIPQTLTVSAGMLVTFDNTSERPMWVASDTHPTHELYPEFDTAISSGRPPAPGEDSSFTFERKGTWKYHDHNNPTATATIVIN